MTPWYFLTSKMSEISRCSQWSNLALKIYNLVKYGMQSALPFPLSIERVQEDSSQKLGSIIVVHPSFCWRIFSQIASFPLIKASLHSQPLYKQKTELEYVISYYLHFPFNIISRMISFSAFTSQVRYCKKKIAEPWIAWSKKQEIY